MVEYTVGTPSIEGGKIVATNGLETLPSVAYSAEQAGSSKGIILEAGKYVVKDKSGNVVDQNTMTLHSQTTRKPELLLLQLQEKLRTREA